MKVTILRFGRLVYYAVDVPSSRNATISSQGIEFKAIIVMAVVVNNDGKYCHWRIKGQAPIQMAPIEKKMSTCNFCNKNPASSGVGTFLKELAPQWLEIQWWIQDFLLEGGADLAGNVDSRHSYVSENLHVKMKELGPLGACASGAPMDPPMNSYIRHWRLFHFLSFTAKNVNSCNLHKTKLQSVEIKHFRQKEQKPK